MTAASAEEENTDDQPDDQPPRRSALAIASIALGAVALVIGFGTWVGWLVVRPSLGTTDVYTVLIGTVVDLVFGALWFAALAAAVLGMVLGLLRGARGPHADHFARLGAMINLIAAAVAVAGTAVFVFGIAQLREPGVYPVFLN